MSFIESPFFARRRMLAAAALVGIGLPAARAASSSSTDAWQPVVLPQARQRDIASAITGQRYRIFVSVPETPPPAGGHPVLYALDGNASFPNLASMARTAARRSKATGQPAPIVVGIGYATDNDYDAAGRTRDYTPPSAAAPATEGGADRFLDFIERELKPLVAAMAPVDPNRQALYGHSYGGLCTLHALFTRPAMFQTYVAASPSIWYRDRIVLGGLEGFALRVKALSARPALLLTAGELEQPSASGAVAPGARAAILDQRQMAGEARNLAARLDGEGTLSRVQFMLFAGENHGSAALPAMARGLEFFMK